MTLFASVTRATRVPPKTRLSSLFVEPAKSTRLDIVRVALDDIVARLADAAMTEEVRDLRRSAAKFERIVHNWSTTPPSEDERASVMKDVLELEMVVIKLDAKGQA